MKNSHLFEAASKPSWLIWARSDTDWADDPRRMRQEFSPICYIAGNSFLFCGDISTNTAPLGNPVQALVKYLENTRRFFVSPVFFSCFTAFSGPTQFHSATRLRP
jgi:hypothetical protein